MRKRNSIKFTLIIIVALGCLLNSAGLAAAAPAASPMPGGIEGIINAMKTLAQVVLTVLMVAASILLAIGIASGAVTGMFGATTGSPYVLAQSWFKIISIIILAVVAFAAPLIAGTVIDTMSGIAGGASIPIFGG